MRMRFDDIHAQIPARMARTANPDRSSGSVGPGNKNRLAINGAPFTFPAPPMTEPERQEILDWIRSKHRAGRALNLHAVKRRNPDLLRRVYEVRPFWGWWQAIRDAGLDYGELKVELEETVTCRICGYEGQQLHVHLERRHGMKSADYRARFPGAEIASEARRARMKKDGGNHLLPHWEPLYSDEYMMDRAWRYHLLGHRLRTTWICEHDHNLWQHIHRQGITWESFITGLGIPYPEAITVRPPGITREELLEGLRRVHRELGETPKITRLTERNHSLITGIRRHFPSYEAALEAAGLPLPDRPFPPRREYSPDEVLETLRRLSAEGVRITAKGILADPARRDLHHAIEKMGGYPALRGRLGVAKPPPPPRNEVKHSREEVIAALRKRAGAGKLYTVPSLREGADADPELLRSAKHHFDRWIDLLEAAGLQPEHHAKPRARRRREEWIAAIRRHHEAGGSLDRRVLADDPVAGPLFRRGFKLFRNWEKALEAAGLPVALADSRESARQEIVSEIRAAFPGKEVPAAAVMKSTPETLDLLERALNVFRSWKAAARAAGLRVAKPPKPDRGKSARSRSSSAEALLARRSEKEARRQAVIEAIRKRREEKRPLYLRGVRDDPTGVDVYREAVKCFRSWKAAVAAAGCSSALKPTVLRSKLAEELDLAYPIPPELYEEKSPGGRRIWKRRNPEDLLPDDADDGFFEGPEAGVPLAPGGLPRGWRIPKRGEKQRHTPSKAAIRKKRKKGRK